MAMRATDTGHGEPMDMSAHGRHLDRLRHWGRSASGVDIRRARRFAVVGGSGVGVNGLLLFLLHGVAAVPLIPAVVLAVELTIMYNYLLHEVWTFARGRLSVRRFAQFNVTALGALAVNTGCVWLLAGVGLHYLLANLVGIAAALAINFTISTTWIWGDRTDGSARDGGHHPGVDGPDRAGHVHALRHALHLGPVRGGPPDEGARALLAAVAVLHRDRACASRGGGHRHDDRPDRP